MPMCMLLVANIMIMYKVLYTQWLLIHMCVFGYATIHLYMHEYMCKSIDKLMYLAAMMIIHM